MSSRLKIDGRSVIAIACLVLFAVSSFIFVQSSSYYVALISLFFLSLSLFHMILAAWMSITRRITGSTDYVYFSLISVGILMFAISKEHERTESYFTFTSMMLPNAPEQAAVLFEDVSEACERYPWLTPQLNKVIRYALIKIYGDEKLDEETCAFVEQVDILHQNNNYEGINNLLNEEFARHELPLSPVQMISRIFSEETMMSDAVYYASRVVFDALYYKSDQFSLPPHESETIALKFILETFWPFVIAVALALRITRVTADVTDWPLEA